MFDTLEWKQLMHFRLYGS